ncbi:MAG: hypothetical protein ACXVB0_12605 [Mucilaginibacter sp.]
MKRCILKISLLCLLSTIFIGRSFGQSALSDSTYLQSATTQTVAYFDKSIGQQSRLYNGHEYLPYDLHIKGTALFPLDVDSWESGEVNYDGAYYKNVPMKYDIYKDVVVVLLYNKFSMFTLLSERVHDFTLAGHHFVRVEADSVNNNSDVITGFYDQLYGGKVEVLARRTKTIQNSSTTTATLETYFVADQEYYLRKGRTYYKVSSQSSFLNVLKDKKSALQQYIRENNIKFRRDPEGAMAKIASYYDHLAN